AGTATRRRRWAGTTWYAGTGQHVRRRTAYRPRPRRRVPPPRPIATMSVRILLVDDQALVRTGLRTILDGVEDFTVVGEAADGLDAIDQTARLRPDMVLMDVRMPHLDGVEATARIRAMSLPPRVILRT